MTPNQKEQFNLSAQDKIRVAVSIAGVEAVWEKLNRFVVYECSGTDADNLTIETDGDVYDEQAGRYLTETELEEFVSWAERESA